jgi:hypothetical protein
LADVAFPGQLSATKMPLSYLCKFRGKTVDEVLLMAADEYLSHLTLNDPGDVDRLLGRMGIDPAPFREHYPALTWMMKRRHRIVHEGDFQERSGRNVSGFTPEEVQTIVKCLGTIKAVSGLLAGYSRDPGPEEMKDLDALIEEHKSAMDESSAIIFELAKRTGVTVRLSERGEP